jgi:cytochrome b subunit of formate dehydrogenase
MTPNPPSAEPGPTVLRPESREDRAIQLIRDDEVFIRMTRAERFQHVTLIVCFVLLVVTGLPLLIDPAAWLKKVFFFESSFLWRGWIHRVAGSGLIALAVFHLIYITSSQRGREVFWALMPKIKDATDALESFGHNLGLTRWLYQRGIGKKLFDRHPYWLFRDPPQYGRHNFIEKFEYLAVWWGNFVMIVTGFLLWAKNVSFRFFPLWVYDIFKIIHSYEAILAFLAIIIWHLYNVHLTPEVFPMSRVWLDGKITGRELRQHHPLEYRELLEERHRRSALPVNPGVADESGTTPAARS